MNFVLAKTERFLGKMNSVLRETDQIFGKQNFFSGKIDPVSSKSHGDSPKTHRLSTENSRLRYPIIPDDEKHPAAFAITQLTRIIRYSFAARKERRTTNPQCNRSLPSVRNGDLVAPMMGAALGFDSARHRFPILKRSRRATCQPRAFGHLRGGSERLHLQITNPKRTA
uniref:Uncharacterized protein n=1 Tax=Candidatus Kentrum sp. UNK TaxID=2126344 RepID=A0A451AKM4_9GAMM|nr:MAG: hypothetical protein BECKUNK1418G_GA0071005_10998 [Candidatus Kentron sp. UNK]VFK69913.1 MAG: hypothetical protein BECKUNK1418H_GA0071006_10218 [Candidatus Kentron sp. UNK]